jgi:hypothetical protein
MLPEAARNVKDEGVRGNPKPASGPASLKWPLFPGRNYPGDRGAIDGIDEGIDMLELRPTCEHCNKPLPPASLEARICSYECTFCSNCVEELLGNVCPNCGGGFCPRPIRPAQNWKNDNYLGKDPASTKLKHRPVDQAAHAAFSATIKGLPPEKR